MNKSQIFKRFMEYILLICFAGYLYVCLEILFRGYSDLSMLFTASICAVPMIALNNIFSYKMDFSLQVAICTFFATFVEYIVGRFFVNQQFQIWDYRNLPLNIDGQVCVLFMLVWMLITVVVIPLFDWIDYHIFNGERPFYKIFGKIFWMKEKE